MLIGDMLIIHGGKKRHLRRVATRYRNWLHAGCFNYIATLFQHSMNGYIILVEGIRYPYDYNMAGLAIILYNLIHTKLLHPSYCMIIQLRQ